MSNELEPYEKHTHVFLIKIWLEDELDSNQKTKWRGQITQIPGGEKKYFEDLNEIILLNLPYLEKIGITAGWFWQFKGWINKKLKKQGNISSKK